MDYPYNGDPWKIEQCDDHWHITLNETFKPEENFVHLPKDIKLYKDRIRGHVLREGEEVYYKGQKFEIHLLYKGDYCALRRPRDENSVFCMAWRTAYGLGPGEGICHRQDIKMYPKEDLRRKVPATTGMNTAPQRSESTRASNQLEGRSTGVTKAPGKKAKRSRATPPSLPSNEGSYDNFQTNYRGGGISTSQPSCGTFDSKPPYGNTQPPIQPQVKMPMETLNNDYNPGVYHYPAESFADGSYHHTGYAGSSRQSEGYLGDSSYGDTAYIVPSRPVPTYTIPTYSNRPESAYGSSNYADRPVPGSRSKNSRFQLY